MRPQIKGIREMQFEGFILHAPDTEGMVQTQEWQGTFRAEFHSGAYTDDDIVDVFTQRIVTPLHMYKDVFIPIGLYHFTRHQLTYVPRKIGNSPTISSSDSVDIMEELSTNSGSE
jgi:hypothetical protein